MENVWNFILEHRLELDFTNVPPSLVCPLCEHVLKNPVHVQCGCRFCAKCIGDYLSNGCGHLCPGCLKEGTNTDLSEDCQVVVDPASNRDMAKLRLKCPHAGCSDSVEMRAMLAHLLICRFAPRQSCIFSEVGCNIGPMEESSMDSHMQEDRGQHRTLISNFVKRTREKEEQLEGMIEELRSDIKKNLMETLENMKWKQHKKEIEKEDYFSLYKGINSEHAWKMGCDKSEEKTAIRFEWFISDMDAHLENGDRYGEVFDLGGYQMGFRLIYFRHTQNRRSYYYIHANVVLYPASSRDDGPEWPLAHDLWMSVMDPTTKELVLERTFGLRHSRNHSRDYTRPEVRTVLIDSDVCIRPDWSFFQWDKKSFLLRCGTLLN